MTQEALHRQAHHAPKHEVNRQRDEHAGNERCFHKRLGAPDGDVGRKRVAVVIHRRAHVFKHRVAEHVADHRGYERDDNGHRHVMADKLAPCVARGKQRSDSAGLLLDRRARGYRKHKAENDDHDVQKRRHHRLIAAHILAGEAYRLVFASLDDIAYAAVGSEDIAKLVGLIAALLIAERFVVIEPCVAQVNVFVNFVEGLGRYDGDAEFICVEHHVGVVFKQRRIVRQRDRARYFKPGKLIADRKAVIFKIQPVGGYLALTLGQAALEHVGPIYLAAVFENAHGVFVIERCFLVKKLMHRNAGGFKPRSRLVRQLILKDEVAAFDIVFFKALVIGSDHAAVGYEKARDKARCERQKQKQGDVFADILPQLSQQAAA